MNNRLKVRVIGSACGMVAVIGLGLPFAPIATGRSPQPALAKQGKTLVAKMECLQCHSVGGQGGCLAPPLDGVTARRSGNYLTLRLSSGPGDEDRFIKLLGHPELFPHLRFPPDQVRALVAYLATIPKVKTPGAVRQGAILYHANECQACHSIGGVGAKSGVPLDSLPASHDRTFIIEQLLDPEEHVRKNKSMFGWDANLMPKPHLSKTESESIADYILSQQKPPKSSTQKR